MALHVTRPKHFKIDQALHGYADGHRLLASSANLKAQDVKTVLTMSDSSGSGQHLDLNGYLTGYPLIESRVYALARTWPAPELLRPGCVWTHTLFIDFEALAGFETCSTLADHFRRPQASSHAAYTKPLDVHPTEPLRQNDPIDLEAIARLLTALYEFPSNRVVMQTTPGDGTDTLVLKIWEQQWPRLRRSFKFCTNAAADRSTVGLVFDLQFVPPNVKRRSDDTVNADAITPSQAQWLRTTVSDIVNPNADLREYLRSAGSDISEGRAAFSSLAELWRIAQVQHLDAQILDRAIDLAEQKLPVEQGRFAKVRLLAQAAGAIGALSPHAMEFIARHFALLDSAAIAHLGMPFASAMWEHAPALLANLDLDRPEMRTIAIESATKSDDAILIAACKAVPSVLPLALTAKPSLLLSPDIWRLPSLDIASALHLVAGFSASQRRNALLAIAPSGRVEVAEAIIDIVGFDALAEAFCCAEAAAVPALDAWFVALARNHDHVAAFLTSSADLCWDCVAKLAQHMRPEAPVGQADSDPWLFAASRLISRQPFPDRSLLPSFFVARALSGRDLQHARLAALAFEPFVMQMADSALPEMRWKMVETHLAWDFSWRPRHRLDRLTEAILELFLRARLPANELNLAVQQEPLFEKVVADLSDISRGRRLLEAWADVLEQSNDAKAKRRHVLIRTTLD